MKKFVLVFSLIFSISLFAEERTPFEVQGTSPIGQGEIYLKLAKSHADELNYKRSIELLEDFLILFPEHPEKKNALLQLADCFEKEMNWEKAIKTNLQIYRNSPFTEEGLLAYFHGAELMARIGEYKRSGEILSFLKKQSYSAKVKDLADIELDQRKILGKGQAPKE